MSIRNGEPAIWKEDRASCFQAFSFLVWPDSQEARKSPLGRTQAGQDWAALRLQGRGPWIWMARGVRKMRFSTASPACHLSKQHVKLVLPSGGQLQGCHDQEDWYFSG